MIFAICRRRKAPHLALVLALAVGVACETGSAFAQQDQAAQSKDQSGGGSASARIGRLEDQFIDLQVMVGTLESLLKSQPGAMLPRERRAAPSPPRLVTDSDLGSRVDALETQIGALTSQLERVTQKIDAIDARLSAAPRPLPPPHGEVPGRQGAAPSASDTAVASGDGGGPEQTGFGTMSIAAGGGDAPPQQENQGGRSDAPRSLPRSGDDVDAAAESGQEQPQSLRAALPENGDARSLYDEGYVQLMQSDYPAAEAAFRELLNRYPNDPLAGDAQYWLGETYYTRGRYKDAAGAFLKGYKTYGSSRKALDSLLKLGMALAQLGQTDEACSTFKELDRKFPLAPGHLYDTARSESRKLGC